MAIRSIRGSTGVSNIMIQCCMPIAHVCSHTLHQSSDRPLLSVWRPQSHQNQEVPERITQWETVTIGNQVLITLARIKLTETNNILRVRLTWLILWGVLKNKIWMHVRLVHMWKIENCWLIFISVNKRVSLPELQYLQWSTEYFHWPGQSWALEVWDS